MTQLELPLDTPPVSATLNERGKRYGDFATQSTLSQTLTAIWKQHYYQTHPGEQIPPFIAEAIEMIIHKLSRIANGQLTYADSYRDIAGFAQLVVDILAAYPGATDATVTITTVPTKQQRSDLIESYGD